MPRFGLAVFALAMCAINVVWIRENTAPPRMWDDAYYLTESVDLFHTFQDKGLGPYLWETTVHSRRGHPPMMKILPTFIYPFLGPGTNAALYAYTVLIPVFCVYLFLLARDLLESEGRALLAVVITCLFPITYGMWRHVMGEFGIAVAVTGCLYHLVRSNGFRRRGHAAAVGAFIGWGLLWKITFPIFVVGPMALVLFRSRRQLPAQRLLWALVPALVIAGPFYARSLVPVLAFTLFAGDPGNQRVWGLGPVYSPLTVARYWLSIVNWGITPYFFALMVLAGGLRRRRAQATSLARDNAFVAAAFLPPFLLLTFHPLKEVRHLLPVLPIVGIVAAGLIADALAPLRRLQPVALIALLAWPAYQFVSWSFDSPLAPRAEVRLGSLMLSTKNLEAASLEWMPTYTYPANPAHWPILESLQVMARRLATRDERTRVHVAGTNPYFNAVTLMHEARILRVPLVFDPPFTDDFEDSDFLVVVLANRRYGPVDERPTAAERALKAEKAPFTLRGTFPIPDGGSVQVYESNRRRRVTS